MAQLKVYCCPIAGREEHMVAATSRKVAAQLLGLSVYELTTYGTDASDSEQVIALAEAGEVFRKGDGFSGSGVWEKVVPATVLSE